MDEELDVVNYFEKDENIKKRKLKNIEEKITDCLDPRKSKMLIDFNNRESTSIKSFAVRKRDKIKVTTCFIAFLLSDQGQNLMTNNNLSIHIESGDIFYQNFNTGENFYNFLMAQQNNQMANIPKKSSYHHSFEHYVKNFLPSFSLDDVDKLDPYSNKNAKYLFYRFNDFIRVRWKKANHQAHL